MKRFTLVAVFALVAFGQNKIVLPQVPVPVAVTTPVMHVDTLALSTVISNAGATATMTLSAPPIAGMGAVVSFQSSQIGWGVFTAVPAIQPSIVFTLPPYTPFTSNDVLTVVYWSTK